MDITDGPWEIYLTQLEDGCEVRRTTIDHQLILFFEAYRCCGHHLKLEFFYILVQEQEPTRTDFSTAGVCGCIGGVMNVEALLARLNTIKVHKRAVASCGLLPSYLVKVMMFYVEVKI